jgi:carboxypeptidase PM20D1
MKKIIKRILLGIGIFFVVIIGICLIRVMTFSSKQIVAGKKVNISVDGNEIARHLAGAIRIKTISNSDYTKMDPAVFKEFHRYLERTYPAIHRTLKLETVNDLSLLYTWEGTDKSEKALMFIAHQDVVPVEGGTLKDWEYPPFSGDIKEGFVWGRGTFDIKNGIITVMDAVENLIKKGYKPKRTIYIAFGHDEEVGGRRGAMKIAKLLKERNVRLRMVLDEGGTIIKGALPMLKQHVALVGVAEKGYVTIKLTARDKGGHSSMPPKITAAGKIARSIERIQSNPFPSTIQEPVRLMFRYLGPEMSFPLRLVFSNMWLFGPILKSQLANKHSTNASLHTTIAPTMLFSGSQQENVLPQVATGTINFRIQLGETIKSVEERVRELVDDESVEIEVKENANNPVPMADVESDEFQGLHRTIAEIFPGVVVAPYLVLGGTDSKHYSEIADMILRFIPCKIDNSDLARMHGTNERISIENLEKGVIFYMRFIERIN